MLAEVFWELELGGLYPQTCAPRRQEYEICVNFQYFSGMNGYAAVRENQTILGDSPTAVSHPVPMWLSLKM